MVGGVGIVYKQDSETGAAGPEDPMLEARVGVLEADMKDVKTSLARLELGFARIEEKFNFVSTKEDLARVESRLVQDIAKVENRLVQNIAKAESQLGQDIAKVESRLGQDIVKVENRLAQNIAKAETQLGQDIAKVENQLGQDIAKVDHSLSQELAKVESRVREDLAELRGRVSNLPTTWQIIGILAALLVGIASLVYATDTFMSRARAPAAVERSPG